MQPVEKFVKVGKLTILNILVTLLSIIHPASIKLTHALSMTIVNSKSICFWVNLKKSHPEQPKLF